MALRACVAALATAGLGFASLTPELQPASAVKTRLRLKMNNKEEGEEGGSGSSKPEPEPKPAPKKPKKFRAGRPKLRQMVPKDEAIYEKVISIVGPYLAQDADPDYGDGACSPEALLEWHALGLEEAYYAVLRAKSGGARLPPDPAEAVWRLLDERVRRGKFPVYVDMDTRKGPAWWDRRQWGDWPHFEVRPWGAIGQWGTGKWHLVGEFEFRTQLGLSVKARLEMPVLLYGAFTSPFPVHFYDAFPGRLNDNET